MKCVLIVQYPALKKSFKKASIKSVCKKSDLLNPFVYMYKCIISDHPSTIYFEWKLLTETDKFELYVFWIRAINSIYNHKATNMFPVKTCIIPNLNIYLIGQSWPDWYALSHMVPTLQLDFLCYVHLLHAKNNAFQCIMLNLTN